jgi:hypothetical protein
VHPSSRTCSQTNETPLPRGAFISRQKTHTRKLLKKGCTSIARFPFSGYCLQDCHKNGTLDLLVIWAEDAN